MSESIEIMRPGISDAEIKLLKPRGVCAAITEPCYWRRDRVCYFKSHCKDKLPLKVSVKER